MQPGPGIDWHIPYSFVPPQQYRPFCGTVPHGLGVQKPKVSDSAVRENARLKQIIPTAKQAVERMRRMAVSSGRCLGTETGRRNVLRCYYEA